MKKIFGVLIVIFLLNSCGSVDTKMDNALQGVNTGMSVSEFKNKVKKSTLVQKEVNYACYKLTKTSAKFGEPGGYVYQTRFFYFKDDKLYRIDEGTRATDLKIEIEQDISTHSESKNNSESPQYVDVVYLKNGSIIKGMIIEQVPNVSLKIQTRDESVFVYKMDEVQKMTKELSKLN
jgi:hypothetical protein